MTTAFDDFPLHLSHWVWVGMISKPINIKK